MMMNDNAKKKPTKETWHDDESTSSRESSTRRSDERNEEAEVRKQSAKETNRVRCLRILVFLALLATAVSVTATTYALLVRQEDENFRNVYAQFARTVADAAVDQQNNLRTSLLSLSDTISLSADLLGKGKPSWPYFFPPMFETYAEDYMKMSRAEFVGISTRVTHDQRDSFVNYSTSVYQEAVADAHLIAHGHLDLLNNDTSKYNPYLTKKTSEGFIEDDERDVYWVRTIQSPPPRKYGPQINWNLASNPTIQANMDSILSLRNDTTISNIRPFVGLPDDEHVGFHSDDNADNPHCFAFHPVYKYAGDSNSDIVAIISTAIAFDASMRNLLPDNVKGMLCVVSNTCNQTVSYMIQGSDAFYQGDMDLHEDKYDDLAVYVDLAPYTNPALPQTPGHCMYSMKIYPTQAFEDDYHTTTPAIFAAIVAGTFLMVTAVFLAYDLMVLKRNELMISNAAQTSAIVSSIVPEHLKGRLLQQQQQQQQQQQRRQSDGSSVLRRRSGTLKNFLNESNHAEGADGEDIIVSAPLADLFVDTTVLFADISGFTAWSSVREPTQVFVLLETLYQSFDRIARKRRVFKVENVGDCYVAVCGLPEPRADHAVALARFGSDIISKMHTMTKKLETTLGPDTGDLCLRVGMHSGPVTAGVLRGERARFQLFGDTMNACARLESSGKPNKIQCSKETAEQLIKFGKGSWVQKRADAISLKGLGSVEAFWVNVHGERAGSVASAMSSEGFGWNVNSLATGSDFPDLDDRTVRLIDWNHEMLSRLLREIGARRAVLEGCTVPAKSESFLAAKEAEFGNNPLEEVREVIELPEFDGDASLQQVDPDNVKIPEEVLRELHHLISAIASMYNDNPFHNFQHASHVVMSVIKLMSRIVAPSHLEAVLDSSQHAAASLHDHTYGITSDPLTQFACAFSALIHDVDHVGVSNAQLVKEGVPIAQKYKERSVAEQNSLDLSWDLLMKPKYAELRSFLFPTEKDLVRFRQLVVNSVMSTDIVDKDLKALRNARWDKAFKKEGGASPEEHNSIKATGAIKDSEKERVDRKATIVIEHIIQASDISHTMQHWHVYRKWNQNLFEELYVAYLAGRMEKNPATFWFKGEFGFFDFYIIPLTKKLKECGVFGVSSDEYLNYALKNREEWEARGEEVVAGMIEECIKKYGVKEEEVGLGELLPEQAPLVRKPQTPKEEVEV